MISTIMTMKAHSNQPMGSNNMLRKNNVRPKKLRSIVSPHVSQQYCLAAKSRRSMLLALVEVDMTLI